MATVLLILSIAICALGALLVPVLIARVPDDYFVRASTPRPAPSGRALRYKHTIGFWLTNVGGVLLVLLGVAMLVLPGPGVLVILMGLSLVSFPGKRRVELRLLRTPSIRRAVDTLRKRAGKPPLRLDASGM